MKRRLFMTIFFMTIAVFLVGMMLTIYVAYRASFSAKRDEFRIEAGFLGALIEEQGAEALPAQGIAKDKAEHFRVTLLTEDGGVIYDSLTDRDSAANHADRKEFILALQSGEGEATRYSDDQREQTYYYAKKLANGMVLRLSSANASLPRLVISMMFPAVGLVAFALILSFLIANRLSENIVRPINELDVSCPFERDTYPELGPLVQKINRQNRELTKKMDEFREEHEKQDRMRREFTANVSHELKTPLTSISGYAEIIRDGIAQEEDIGRFAGKIYDEANRLVVLVGDIIRLSQLDDNEIEPRKEDVNLYEICKDTIEHLGRPAEQKHISISLEGTEEKIFGVEPILVEMVYNLIDNSIKYNRDGGYVKVKVAAVPEGTLLQVSDNGIGIPKEDLPRIFERFYRVDKSHSKEVGGTGLGLSIVKHGASYHGATVEVSSEVEKGTTIDVIFARML